MAVEIRERQIAASLGQPNFPQPRRFRTLQPRSWQARSPTYVKTWNSSGVLTNNLIHTAARIWGSVSDVISYPGDFRSPTAHQYSFFEDSGSGKSGGFYANGVKQWEREGTYHAHSAGWVLLSYTTLPYIKSHLDTGIYNAALEKLNQVSRGGIDLSIDIIQAGQTAKLLKQIDDLGVKVSDYVAGKPNAFRQDMRRVKRDPLRYLRYFPGVISKTSRVAANRWLEWQYGIRPSLNTIYECGEKALHVVLNKTRWFKASYTEPLTSHENWPIFLDDRTHQVRLNVTGRVGCVFEIELLDQDPGLAEYSSLNPASILYEALPFSFVADWVYDLGSYFRNYETALLYNNRFKSGVMKQFCWSDASYKIDKYYLNSGAAYYYNYVGQQVGRRFKRTILNAYPAPYLPQIKAELGSSRLLSAAALLRGLLK